MPARASRTARAADHDAVGAYAGQFAPVYVDAFEEPGRLLYRFDALIHNDGRRRSTSTGDPDGTVAAGSVAGRAADGGAGARRATRRARCRPRRTGAGARIEYVVEETHAHFHFFTAARYELLVPGAAPRVSGKIGFCMFDSFDIPGGSACWFRPERAVVPRVATTSPASCGWASRPARPTATAPSASSSTSTSPASPPASYRLRGIANPEGHVLEDDLEPDVLEEDRVVPGVSADPGVGQDGAGAPARGRGVGARDRARDPGSPAASCTPRSSVGQLLPADHRGTPLTLRGRDSGAGARRGVVRRRAADLRARRRASSGPTR